MARKDPSRKIEFTRPATISEMIDALEDLRARFGNDCLVRVTGFVRRMHAVDGPLVKALVAEPES